MQSKPVCSICGHGDPYPWGPSCGGTHSDEYEAALFVSIGGKKIPHNDAIWEVKKTATQTQTARNGAGLKVLPVMFVGLITKHLIVKKPGKLLQFTTRG